MSVTDAEKAFYESVLADPDSHSIQDLRYAFFLAGADGGVPVVDPSVLQDGYVPVWDAATGKWAPGPGGGAGAVSSVNGKVGDVTLAASDVGAVAVADVAGLDDLGWGRAVFIANGGTVPAGTPTYTIVIEMA